MPTFTGQLNSNEIFAALFNMIISIRTYSDNIKGLSSSLVDKARVDGGLYGDTKIYTATDALKSYEWLADAEAANLLQLHRPPAPEQQAIELNIFRIIPLTVDEYLSKRAWQDAGSFAQFNSTIKGWLSDTKKIYDVTTYNTFLGTDDTQIGSQHQGVDLSSITETGEEKNRLEAMAIGQKIADIFTEAKDVSRDYNDYGFLRAWAEEDLVIVWNAAWVNKIRYVDLPTIFHESGIMKDLDQNNMNARYFGTLNTSGGTTTSSNTTIRSMVEKDYGSVHLFPGDLLPNSTQYLANETYTENSAIICKILHKESIPFMSAFQTETSFFNARSLTTNMYMIWGRNELEHLSNYPLITVEAI